MLSKPLATRDIVHCSCEATVLTSRSGRRSRCPSSLQQKLLANMSSRAATGERSRGPAPKSLRGENTKLKVQIARLKTALKKEKEKNKNKLEKKRRVLKTAVKKKEHRRAASKAYSGKDTQKSAEAKRFDRYNSRVEELKERERGTTALTAVAELQRLGFVAPFLKCLGCKKKGVKGPKVEGEGENERVVVCCPHNGCRLKKNVLAYSVFEGSRLRPQDLLETLRQWGKGRVMKGTTVEQLCQQTKFGKWSMQNVHSSLLTVETNAGKASSDAVDLSGDLEGDAVAIKKARRLQEVAMIWVTLS
jgi:hypothetical protein